MLPLRCGLATGAAGNQATPGASASTPAFPSKKAAFDFPRRLPDPSPMSEDDDLKARGDRLAEKLHAAQAERGRDATSQVRNANSNAAAMSLAVRAASEIVAGVAVGAVLGWGIDRLFHTKPAFLIIFLLLGSAAGIGNVIRATTPKGGA